ncbi:MAG: hypothetical protein NT094_04610 [Candidatus Staskawiczbacteria bacterium]|nr:hypothetical protein [Candidatus Staskawiczbacteria bacterium]
MGNILFIDGRNFLGKLKEVLDPENKKDIDFSICNLKFGIEYHKLQYPNNRKILIKKIIKKINN